MKNIKNDRHISLLSHMYKLLTHTLQIHDENHDNKPVSEKVTQQLIIFKQSISWQKNVQWIQWTPLYLIHWLWKSIWLQRAWSNIYGIENNRYKWNPYHYSKRYVQRSYCKSTYGQSSLGENINTERRESGRPNFSQIILSNGSRGL